MSDSTPISPLDPPSSLEAPPNPFVPLPAPLAASSSSTAQPVTDQINDPLSRDFPQLAHLSQDDMLSLLEDEAFFDAYFHTMPQALELHQTHETRLRANIAIAEKNEAMRPALEALRTETATLFNEANELKQRWALLAEAQAGAVSRFSPHSQLSRLSRATSAQEHLSEQLVSAFIDGGGDEESFVKQYREIRKVYHKRAGSLRKWEEGAVVWRG